ncbi:hypothetical protein TNCT_266641 [Trichonephila clavata]|uniref:Uncharacterized protein n=1 Tax=Trichonephila clavata TaxID=2740835 RepID=A0A8X6H5C6_TRICU|nr:hypothetical protein TNCT_266641 [Trichonephila clavata]
MYPEPDWGHIYTDGSLSKNSDSTGAGVYCMQTFLFLFNNWKIHNRFDGEFAALQVDISHLHCDPNSFCMSSVLQKCSSVTVITNSTLASSNFLDCKKLLQCLSE